MSIRFETSGWRAVIADEFTFAGVRKVTEGICTHFEATANTYIGELINEDKIILGDEESAGLSIKGHYPEKDGILACLLAAEAVAARRASLTEQLNALYAQVGTLEAGRIGVRLTPELMASLHLRGIRISKGLGGAS